MDAYMWVKWQRKNWGGGAVRKELNKNSDPQIHVPNAPNWDKGYKGTALLAELIVYGYYTKLTDTTTDNDDKFWDDKKEEATIANKNLSNFVSQL